MTRYYLPARPLNEDLSPFQPSGHKNWAVKVITKLYGKKAICASHFFIQRINQIIVDRVALCRDGKELSKKRKPRDEWTFSQKRFQHVFPGITAHIAADKINPSASFFMRTFFSNFRIVASLCASPETWRTSYLRRQVAGARFDPRDKRLLQSARGSYFLKSL